MIYTCSVCGKIFVDNSAQSELIFARGYWWHRACAKIRTYFDNNEEYISFPSSGKLCRSTLFMETGE